jgi:Tol biopolymer transport system component
MRFRIALAVRIGSVLLLAVLTLCGLGRPFGLSPGSHASPLPGPAAVQRAGAERLAFEAGGEIYLINPDGSGLTRVTHSAPGVYNYQPALSPDGTRIAFGSALGGKSVINLINVDGSGLRSLTDNRLSYDGEPAWSPDASKIAFVRGYDPTRGGVANFSSCGSEIYVVDVDGPGDEINLTQGYGGTDPSWSPDGKRLAFASNRDDNFDIYAVSWEGGEVEQLTRTESDEGEPAWSPDGQTIAFARGYVRHNFDCGFAHTGFGDPPLSNGPDVYMMPSDGGEPLRLTETENNFDPAWSPDGASLAFVSFRGGESQILAISQFSDRPLTITSGPAHKSSPSWSRVSVRLPGGAR